MDELLRVPGMYRFYGENDVLLYVGKSTNIPERVTSHFSGDYNSSRPSAGVRVSVKGSRMLSDTIHRAPRRRTP
ncbi:GIY-YIG nuclease family protein [Marinobacter sp.]|uniref:GIY-YIG nuclease family protein n=1 Tax=Marinobacter sp. TaxID=50741 RepID=UPI003975D299